MAVGTTKVVQVTNIAPQATKDQMHILFGYLGKIEDIRLYPTIRDVSCPVQSRICYIKFVDTSTVGIAQHMTNTVFIDRALIVIPVQNGEIPDEYYALEMTRNGTIVPGLNVNEPIMPPNVTNSVQGTGSEQVIVTTDPQLEASGLPLYPPLPSSYDSTKIEETRRTILVQNISPTVNTDELIEFFSPAGEVKYLRTCARPDGTNHMLIEFSDQSSIIGALKLNGNEFGGKPIEIQHATQPIVKPQAKSNEAAQKEIEEAMSRFKEAQNMINASIEPVIGMLTKDKRSSRRSRSRSRGRRRRTRSRSRPRRSRSRKRRSSSRSRRSRSRDSRRRRSKSRSRKRSTSRSRRSRSKSSRGSRRSRSRKRSRARDSRARSKGRESRPKSKDRESRARSKDRESRARSKDRKSKDRESRARSKGRESRARDATRGRSKEVDAKTENKDKEVKPRDRSRDRRRSRDRKTREPDRKSKDKAADAVEKKRSRSRSKSRRRSRSRDRKAKERRRSRSRGGRRRTPSPRGSRKRTKSRSRDRDRKRERKEKPRERSRSKSRSKVARNYDEEEKGFNEKPRDGAPEAEDKSENMDISNSP